MKGKSGKELPPALTQFITDMCGFYDLKVDDIDFTSETWFSDYTCNPIQEEKFIAHIEESLKDKKHIYHKLFHHTVTNQFDRTQATNELILMYGFRCLDN